jgi:hypothetical protein
MFSWWILHDCSLEVVLIIFRVKNEVHLSTKGTYSTIFYTLESMNDLPFYGDNLPMNKNT